MNPSNYSNKLIAFVDVLGFGSLVNSSQNDDDASEIIERISDAILSSRNSLEESGGNYQFTQFSDSFVISRPVDANPIDQAHFALALLKVIDEFLKSELLLRGGVAQGKLIHSDKLLFGPAMNRAYELESKLARVPRIVLDPKLSIISEEIGPASIRQDKDGLNYIDYFSPQKVFYLVPSWLLLIRRVVKSVPESTLLKEKREWLISRFNQSIDEFSYVDFEDKLKEKAEDRPDIARDYEELISSARSLEKL